MPLGRLWYPHVYFGPYYAQKINSTYTVTDLQENTASNTKSIAFKPNDYGTVTGVGLDIRGETLFLTFDARYSRGLRHIDTPENHLPGIRNQGLMLSAGIGIQFH